MRTEHRFDLSEFDPKATVLDLSICSPQKIEFSIVAPSG
jgi:hypothetical protein